MVPDPVLKALTPDENKSLSLVLSHSILTSFATLTVIFRLISKHVSRELRSDDLCIVLAMGIAILNLPFTIFGAQHGVGQHTPYLEPSDLEFARKTLIVNQFLLLTALGFAKMSALLFVFHIRRIHKWLKGALLFTMVLVSVTTLASCVLNWTQCTKVEANWEPNPGIKCMPIDDVMLGMYVFMGFTIAGDFLCALLPLAVISQLHFPARKGILAAIVIFFGALAAACSIIRTWLVRDYRHTRTGSTYACVDPILWAMIQLHAVIIIASIPACPALAMRLWASVSDTGSSAHCYSDATSLAPGLERKPSTTINFSRPKSVPIMIEDDSGRKKEVNIDEHIAEARMSHFSDFSDDGSFYSRKTLTRVIEEYEVPQIPPVPEVDPGDGRIFRWI